MKKLKDLPVGALVKDIGTTYNGTPIIWRILEHGHTGDPEGSTTLESRDILTLKAFDAKEPNNSNKYNQQYGNGLYEYSNILQWLNSNKPANEWYTNQHEYDQSPNSTDVVSANPYAVEAGFLTNFSKFLKNNILLTSKVYSPSESHNTNLVTSIRKIFLLSFIEVSNNGYAAEGTTYSYYLNATDTTRLKNIRDEAAIGDYVSSSCKVGSPWDWYLRTCTYRRAAIGSGGSYYDQYPIKYVTRSGGIYTASTGYMSSGSIGIAPAFNILSNINVSDSKDSDDCYTILYNSFDRIIPDKTDLGNRVSGFNIGYTITDIKQGQYSAVVELDDTQVDSISDVVLGQHYTHEVTTSALNQLSIGEHTIIITITSNEGDTESKTITFNHVADELFLTGSDEDLGNVWHKSQLTYQVRGVEDKSVTVTESLDGTQVRSFEATLDTDIVFDDTGWKDMGDEAFHTAVITATNEDDVTVIRTWKFIKLMDELCFYTKPKATLNPATKINVVVGYEKAGNPTLKVEVTNNALAGYPIWEDASAAVNAGKAYEFTNIPNNSAEYGVSVKVTIMKSAETERVYAHYVGYSYA